MSDTRALLQPKRNCWRLASAARLAWLIDAEAYYSALHATLCRARHSVLIIGWDIDSRVELLRDGKRRDYPVVLADLLNALLEERADLQVHVLGWDFSMIYALERSWLPLYQFSIGSHSRLRFYLDDQHPIGASHHQKLVVVDDSVAFCGGLDLTKARWDTVQHSPDERRRRGPGDVPYRPFHDVQAIVAGDVARALGGLARQRWYHATGKRLEAPPTRPPAELWPDEVAAELEGHDIAIARTRPAQGDLGERREIERLYVDAIAAARDLIYIENQYLTSAAVADAIERSLAAATGAEILIVLPGQTSGWLEQSTMDVLRARVLRRLRDADHGQRLRVRYPHRDGSAETITVHSKLIVVDDRFASVGSANLSNRSMGLDTECNLALEATNEAARGAVSALMLRLLAEHCGREPQQVAALLRERGSLFAALDELDGGARRLAELDVQVSAELDQLVPGSAVIDPERPMPAEQLFGELIDEHLAGEPEPSAGGRRRRIGLAVGALALLLGLAALWQFSPLGEWLSIERLQSLAAAVKDQPWAPLATVGVYVVAGLLVAPLTALIVVTVLVFGGLHGFVYAYAGSIASAAVGYGLGAVLGRRTIRQLAGPRVNRISERLGEQSVLTIAALRLVPIAPYTVINVVAGASHLRFANYLAGTCIGMLPGMLAIAFVVSGAAAALGAPGLDTIGMLLAGVAAVVLASLGLRAWLRARARARS